MIGSAHSWLGRVIGAMAVAVPSALLGTMAVADDGVPQCMIDHQQAYNSSTEYLMHLGEKIRWSNTAMSLMCKEPADKSLPTWLVKVSYDNKGNPIYEPYVSAAQKRHGITLPTSTAASPPKP